VLTRCCGLGCPGDHGTTATGRATEAPPAVLSDTLVAAPVEATHPLKRPTPPRVVRLSPPYRNPPFRCQPPQNDRPCHQWMRAPSRLPGLTRPVEYVSTYSGDAAIRIRIMYPACVTLYMTWIRTYSRCLFSQYRLNMNRIPYSFPRSAYSTCSVRSCWPLGALSAVPPLRCRSGGSVWVGLAPR